MRTSLLLSSLLSATAWAAPDHTLTVDVADASAGDTITVTVSQAPRNATVYVGWSNATGSFCPSILLG
jgi:hypothetical protein